MTSVYYHVHDHYFTTIDGTSVYHVHDHYFTTIDVSWARSLGNLGTSGSIARSFLDHFSSPGNKQIICTLAVFALVFLSPLPPNRDSMSVLDVPRIRSLDQKGFYLTLLLEAFTYELEREMQVRSEGGPSLPQEWVAHLERNCQAILDKIHQNHDEHGPDDWEESSLPSDKIQEAYTGTTPTVVHPSMQRVVPPTPVPRLDIALHNGRNSTLVPSSQSITSSSNATGRSNLSSNIPSPSQQHVGFLGRPVLREIEGMLVIGWL
jgi:hypothetical protein